VAVAQFGWHSDANRRTRSPHGTTIPQPPHAIRGGLQRLRARGDEPAMSTTPISPAGTVQAPGNRDDEVARRPACRGGTSSCRSSASPPELRRSAAAAADQRAPAPASSAEPLRSPAACTTPS
jgi:hypothetical protein